MSYGPLSSRQKHGESEVKLLRTYEQHGTTKVSAVDFVRFIRGAIAVSRALF